MYLNLKKKKKRVKGPRDQKFENYWARQGRSVDLHHQHLWELVRKHKLSGATVHTPTDVEPEGIEPSTSSLGDSYTCLIFEKHWTNKIMYNEMRGSYKMILEKTKEEKYSKL